MPDGPQRRGQTEEQIDEAIKRGEFENLNGKGKPLKLWGDLAERRVMSQKLNHDDRQSAPWDDAARAVDALTRRAENEIKRALEFRRAGLNSKKADPVKIEADFRAQIRATAATIQAANSQILRHNLLIPPALPRLHRPRLKLSELMARLAPEIRQDGQDWTRLDRMKQDGFLRNQGLDDSALNPENSSSENSGWLNPQTHPVSSCQSCPSCVKRTAKTMLTSS